MSATDLLLVRGGARLLAVSLLVLSMTACDDGGDDPAGDDTLTTSPDLTDNDVLDMADTADSAMPPDDTVPPGDTSDAHVDAGPACGFGQCAPGELCCDYTCVDPSTDPTSCGACGVTCDALETCAGGTCTCDGQTCGSGLGCCEVDGQAQCINLVADTDNCGACGNVCAAGEACIGGTCGCLVDDLLERCGSAEACCPDVGCRSLDDDPDHCGGCGIACGPGELCVDGTCGCGATQATTAGATACAATEACCGSPATCKPLDDPECACGTSLCGNGQSCCGVDDGAGSPVDLCIDTWRDADHCGACGVTCGAGQRCRGGSCDCQPGLADCNGDPVDGCEVALRLDPDHCGACGVACAPGELCDGTGQCAQTCAPWMSECFGECVDLDTDGLHCGACGNACPSGYRCDGSGLCVETCPSHLATCGGSCIDLLHDNFNCGACGAACAPGERCDGTGQCAPSCQLGLEVCDGLCFDLRWSREHCGACGNACPAGEVCDSGQCVLTCPSNTLECGGGCVDPTNNFYHCGACFNACRFPDQRCESGACEVRCVAGLELCAGSCVDTATDPLNCGGCGITCAASEICAEDPNGAGVCVPRCPTGLTFCTDTCVSTLTDSAHCGGCGLACATGEVCTDGMCCPPLGCSAPTDLAVGGNFHCAVLDGGALACWGASFTETTDTPTILPGYDGQTPATTVVEVAMTGSHLCALMADDTVRCRGSNSQGQLGIGSYLEPATPRPVVFPAGTGALRKLEVAGARACALTDSGQVYCWGDGFGLALGTGLTEDEIAPVRVPGLSNVLDIAMLDNETTCAVVPQPASDPLPCATGAATVVTCWGNGQNLQLGCEGCDASTTLASATQAFVAVEDGTSPSTTRLCGVAAIDGGTSHACALTHDRRLFCWGDNNLGQLGDGCDRSTSGSCVDHLATEVVVDTSASEPSTSGFAAVDAGSGDTCAVTLEGRAMCWGSVGDGRLGHGCDRDTFYSCPSSTVARHVRTDTGTPLNGVVQITAGSGATCARLVNGNITCWGDNASGQLGTGVSPIEVPIDHTTTLPEAAVGLELYYSTTCARLATTGLTCWGYPEGLLDFGLDPTLIPDTAGIVDVAINYATTCVLDASGAVRCMGQNYDGQLGNGCDLVAGTCMDSPTFVPVVGLDGVTNTVVDLASADASFCAVLDTGVVKCWGSNWDGFLGNGTYDAASTPTDVVGLGGAAVEIDGSESHYCVRLDTGAVRCWGSGWDGQLGAGDWSSSPLPVTVSGLDGMTSSAQAIDVGGYTSCALRTDGRIACWGSNYNGQFGDGTTTSTHTPVLMTGIDGTTRVASDLSVGYHTCVLLSTGAVECVGENDDGQLGTGTAGASTSSLAQAWDLDGTLASASAVAVGYRHTCVVLDPGGQVRCWGQDNGNAVGTGTAASPTPTLVSLP